jgi:hypothetical protein
MNVKDFLIQILPPLLIVIGAICYQVYKFRKTKLNKKKAIRKRIAEEEQVLKEMLSSTNQSSENVSSFTPYEIGASSSVTCPYCKRTFDANSGKCPGCGATAIKAGNKITITQVTEHQEVLKALEYKHIEKLAALKNEQKKISEERKKHVHDTLIGIVIVIAASICFVGMIYIMATH